MPILLFIARVLGPFLPEFAAWVAGRQSARLKARNDALEGYKDTLEKIDAVEDITDPNIARRRLRERNPKQP